MSSAGPSDFDLSPRPQIEDLLSRGNLAQAEILLRLSLEQDPCDPVVYNYLGLVALSLDLPGQARSYFKKAVNIAPAWEVPSQYIEFIDCFAVSDHTSDSDEASRRPVAEETTGRFLLIKAWGFGFWSDVSHVLSQLLLAEMTERIPVVHWGANSLFGDGCTANAFDLYFEPISSFSLDDIAKEGLSIWPPKWNRANLAIGEINKMQGEFSRISGLYLLGRSEDVLVADYHTGIVDLCPWISASSPLHGLSVDGLSRYLMQKYLRPLPAILNRVDEFYDQHLREVDFLSVHIRGSDKALELDGLHELNDRYRDVVRRMLAEQGCEKIFLITDDAAILDTFRQLYGDQIVTTDCLRTLDSRGVHYQHDGDGHRLGIEVMCDAYLAARGKAFIGNGFSNVSLFVNYIKDWPEGSVCLLGPNLHHMRNTLLHAW